MAEGIIPRLGLGNLSCVQWLSHPAMACLEAVGEMVGPLDTGAEPGVMALT